MCREETFGGADPRQVIAVGNHHARMPQKLCVGNGVDRLCGLRARRRIAHDEDSVMAEDTIFIACERSMGDNY
jgi:hypothetical protein